VLSLILFQNSDTKGNALEFQREILCLREKAPLPDLFHTDKTVVEGWLDALASEPYRTAGPGFHLCGEETWVKYFTCICRVYRDIKGSVEYEEGDDAPPVYASSVLSISCHEPTSATSSHDHHTSDVARSSRPVLRYAVETARTRPRWIPK
jgi:hypothetical protein